MPTARDVITIPSAHSPQQTLDRLDAVLNARGIKVFARVDHAGEAARVGLTMRPTQVLIFGNPLGGTPIMLASPLAAIDLPLKALAWQDADGNSWLSSNDPHALADRFGVPPDLLAPISGIAKLLELAASSALIP